MLYGQPMCNFTVRLPYVTSCKSHVVHQSQQWRGDFIVRVKMPRLALIETCNRYTPTHHHPQYNLPYILSSPLCLDGQIKI